MRLAAGRIRHHAACESTQAIRSASPKPLVGFVNPLKPKRRSSSRRMILNCLARRRGWSCGRKVARPARRHRRKGKGPHPRVPSLAGGAFSAQHDADSLHQPDGAAKEPTAGRRAATDPIRAR